MASATTSVEAERVEALIGGEWRKPAEVREVRDPYRGDVVAFEPTATEQDGADAIAAAHAASEKMAAMPGYERAALLRRAADRVEAHADEIGHAMARETGKALRDSLGEARRSADSLRLCAEEAVRIEGEHVPMDSGALGAGKIAMVMRFPVGIVVGITPFNAPVNCAAHKIGSAIAAGNSIILKPSPKAPLCIHKFMAALMEADMPPGAVNAVYGDAVGAGLVSHPQVGFVSFTGSIPVGKIIRNTVGMKRVALELGGVGPTFVHGDADLSAAATACARNAMLVSGQSCISVQNVYVQRPVFERFVEMVIAEIDRLKVGDPLDMATDVGTLIDEAAARRVADVLDRAVDAGAKRLRGGDRRGAQLDPTVLVDVDETMTVVRDELFGPGMTIQPYDEIEPIFKAISDSPYGLQCGIYTRSLPLALTAIKTVRTGGVIVNGTSRWRSDQMPYGGIKDSGIGREGPKYAIKEMMDERFFVLN